MHRTDETNRFMIAECVGHHMMKMSKHNECVRHMAFVAPPTATAADLSKYCESMSQVFSVADATQLCTGLNDVHKQFWPKFME